MIIQTDILGVNMGTGQCSECLSLIDSWITHARKKYICVSAVHLIMECQKNPALLSGVNKAGLVVPDGMPLVWILKRRGYRFVERIYGPDLTKAICRLAEQKKYTIFLLGGKNGQGETLSVELKQRFPKLSIAGYCDTPDKKKAIDDKNILAQINSSRPDIVLVGLGCPFQEWWMIKNQKNVKARILIGVGAAFDILSGYQNQTPRFLQDRGLEWAFRLSQDPLRLWKRYLMYNTQFLFQYAKFLLKFHRY